MPICLYKHGFIDLSFILQAVKCHAASSAKKTAANPRPTYAIFSNIACILIDRYNVVYSYSKYLTEYNQFYLTNDNKWNRNELQLLHS